MLHFDLAQFVAGWSAGAVTTVILHPVDLYKVNRQLYLCNNFSSLKPKSFVDFLHKRHSLVWNFARQQKFKGSLYALALPVNYLKHLFRLMYQGLFANAVASTVTWGTYFLIYDSLKQSKSSAASNNKNGRGSDWNHFQVFGTAGTASLITVLLTNPLWTIKVRACGQPPSMTLLADSSLSLQRYLDLWLLTWRNNGFRALYAGLGPGTLGCIHGAIQFAVYEPLKAARLDLIHNDRSNNETTRSLSTGEYVLCSSVAKTVAVICTYPLTLLRSRMQFYESKERSFLGYRQVIVDVLREGGGWRGFYRGLGAGIVRVMPSTWITFVTYETIVNRLKSKSQG